MLALRRTGHRNPLRIPTLVRTSSRRSSSRRVSVALRVIGGCCTGSLQCWVSGLLYRLEGRRFGKGVCRRIGRVGVQGQVVEEVPSTRRLGPFDRCGHFVVVIVVGGGGCWWCVVGAR